MSAVNDETTNRAVLQVKGLRKVFGGVVAIKHIDFELRAGEVHGLCGENGAGKSTLVKILGGLLTPTEGDIRIDGAPLKPGQMTDPALISIVHQELSVIPDLSVLDNVLLGDVADGEWLRRGRHAASIRRQLDDIGLPHVQLDQPARELSLAEQQLIEIARGVARGARILILDEPTATLSDVEIRRVFAAVRWLREKGSTVVFISHRLPEVFEITDRVTVFRNGERVATKPTSEFTTRELVQAMIGREVGSRHAMAEEHGAAGREIRLSVREFSVPGRFRPLTLDVARGEVLAITGQLGSGADAITEALGGLRPGYVGTVALDGQGIEIRSVAAAMRNAIAYVSEDRAEKGVFLEASIQTNICSSILDRVSRFGFVRGSLANERARSLASRFQIDPHRLPDDVWTLSGGNQQKVSLASSRASSS